MNTKDLEYTITIIFMPESFLAFHSNLIYFSIYSHVILVTFNIWEKQLYHYINVLISIKQQNPVVNIYLSTFKMIA